jgi:hypothetical protein
MDSLKNKIKMHPAFLGNVGGSSEVAVRAWNNIQKAPEVGLQ